MSLSGFAPVERQNVKLEVGQDIRIDVSLKPGQQNELVTVQAEAPLIETNNAELGGTIANAVINDLPLNGRNFENLLDLRPGVSKYPGNSGWTNSTNGGRPHDNYFMVDGINSNDPWMAQSMMNAVMAAGDAGTVLPIDAIDEFKTTATLRPEFEGVHYQLGLAQAELGLYDDAIASFQNEIANADDYDAEIALAHAYEKKGMHEKAAEAMERAQRLKGQK